VKADNEQSERIEKLEGSKKILSELPNFYVIPECEFYREDSSCKRADYKNKKYACNELWCTKKVDNVLVKGLTYPEMMDQLKFIRATMGTKEIDGSKSESINKETKISITPTGFLNAMSTKLPKFIENRIKQLEKEQTAESIDLSRRCSRCGNELNIEPTVDPLCETCFELQCQEEQTESKLTPEDKVDEILGDPGELYEEKPENIIDDCHNCGLRDLCKDAKYNDKCMRWKSEAPCKHEYDFNYDCIICGKNLLDNIDRTYLTTEFDLHNTHKIVRRVFIDNILEGYETLKEILNMNDTTDKKKLQVLRDTLISQQQTTKKEVE